MDPLTQGVLGAALPQATLGGRIQVRAAGALGFAAGMAADLDAFIRSTTDPLAFLEYHRHFTHSLIFIPVGGLLCALALHWTYGKRAAWNFRTTFLVCTLGYGTHALLDAATSYGTLLLWPFSDARISFSIISVIDPLFTLPLGASILAAAWWKRPVFAAAGLAWAACYLAAGLSQRTTAEAMAKELAEARGHMPVRVDAKPSFGNIIVWKTIYETAEDYHIDAVRAGFAPKVFPGTALPKLDLRRDLPWLDQNSQQARDIERFRYFSHGFVAQDPHQRNRIIDIRYSFVPNEAAPLWSIELSPVADPAAHVVYMTHRSQARESLNRLWRMATAQ